MPEESPGLTSVVARSTETSGPSPWLCVRPPWAPRGAPASRAITQTCSFFSLRALRLASGSLSLGRDS